MKNSDFNFIIANDGEREELFCEIHFQGSVFAEISQEEDEPKVAIFSHP